MRDIKDLITKLTGIKDPKEDKDIISGIVKEICGFEIQHKDIEFSGDILKFKVGGPQKNSIFMFQQKIILALQEKITDRKITRII